MSQHNLDWTQHEVSFGVWDRDKNMGLLRMIPLGCHTSEQREDPDSPRYTAYGIYIQVKLERLGLECTGYDFVHPNVFRKLLALLKNVMPPPPKVVLFGDEGGIEILFDRQEDGYISVFGRIPGKGGISDSWFSGDSMRLRDAMKITVEFEFMLSPQQALESSEELENLLAHIRSVEEQESR
jgi:hypothetical protein